MCTSLWLLHTHPRLRLLLLFNRDEFYNRCVVSRSLSGAVHGPHTS
jgi:uncharacterized protein with NRDE domain